ncbi:MAG: 26S protease regulatory subunit [Saprospiraceae bacterium]|nr:26S protease regulatory subunit [Saprospiraceae bacterium]MBX7179997.1 AAA family ATPase [Saprospiraceae bacterium]MCB0591631.1 26S protease regulatory subunit [Saprospiraceae bacterium]MCO5283777.1 AAA family ATPase [Saprospiraceae bacterium]MCO6470626.1 26S protease regulatory subunit [Saprospiraceae bacterium]
MNKDFEIKFGKSTSSKYQNAVNIAKKFSDFTALDGQSYVNIIKADSEEIYNKYKTFENLYSIIYGWKSTVFTYKGQEIDPYNFFQQFNLILKCSKEYENSVVKETYCNLSNTLEGWGCKHLTDIKRHLDSDDHYYSSTEYWYRFGNFESEKVWKVNKALIKEHLKKEAKNKRIEHCPIFSIEKVFKVIDELPDTINLGEGSSWEIEYKEDFFGTTIQRKPISIKHISKDSESMNHLGAISSLSSLLKGEENDDEENEENEENEEDDKRKRFIPDVTFEDIGGIETIIDQIREVIELPLKRPEIYHHLGIKPHKGILLFGDPGNGKTLVAKAIANEVKAHFIPISGPELVSKWHGQSEENLRNIFKEARKLQPSIIFFDEIDSVAQKRSDDESARLDAKFVNQLLTLMDGMEAYHNVTILASTNRPELLDDALLRPGRFDFKIEIQKPDEIGCYKILKVASRKMPLDKSLDIKKIVPRVVGCSGAEIVFIVKEAAINALKRTVNVKDIIMDNYGKDIDIEKIKVTQEDFIRAIDKLKANTIN